MNRRRAKWIAVIVSLVVGVALLILCPLGFLYSRRLDQARAEYAPPTVYITEPQSGASVSAGTRLLVLATALGATPITRIELWSGGQLVETQASEMPEGTSPLGAAFELLVAEGPNMLFARAVNAAGIIGQSLPVGIVGGPKPGPGETFLAITVEEGQTLADVATSYETDPQTLQELNPGLGDQEPPPGSLVTVPAPPETEAAEEAPPSSVVPTPASAPMPDTPPLQPLQPSPGMTSTVPLPVIVGSIFPKLAIPVFTPPAAPTDLQGYVDNCKVRLRWNDNAWDELRYELWMAATAGSSRLVASLQPAAGGAAWVEFAAPQPGNLSFWVEAVNFVGKQPSNIVQVQVDPQCPSPVPSQLQVDVLDMTVRGNYDQTYCYVSLENLPELRMPADDSAFVQVQGGRGD
ncbi:MAG TPA: Ig-like domain-containing protein, partial [Anaerolineae bacterium]|nr:Ig-like domain-containing protein [Anaerolineae bacterium]